MFIHGLFSPQAPNANRGEICIYVHSVHYGRRPGARSFDKRGLLGAETCKDRGGVDPVPTGEGLSTRIAEVRGESGGWNRPPGGSECVYTSRQIYARGRGFSLAFNGRAGPEIYNLIARLVLVFVLASANTLPSLPPSPYPPLPIPFSPVTLPPPPLSPITIEMMLIFFFFFFFLKSLSS